MGFPERLKQLRKEKGLSQIMLAQEQGTLNNSMSISVSVRSRPVVG